MTVQEELTFYYDKTLDIRNTITWSDVILWLRNLPDNILDCVIFSPPYFAVRDYGIEGQIGLEPEFDCRRDFKKLIEAGKLCGVCYICRFVEIMTEVRRVLKPTGTVFVNLGDTFFGSGFGADDDIETTKQGSNGGTIEGRDKIREFRKTLKGYPKKSLCLIPERFVTAMRDEVGFIVRDKPIWDKPNAFPSSAPDRRTLNYENWYMLSKQEKYYFNKEAIRILLAENTVKRYQYAIGTFKSQESGVGVSSRHSDNKISLAPKMPAFGGSKHAGNNGNDIYSGKVWNPSDGRRNPSSVMHIFPFEHIEKIIKKVLPDLSKLTKELDISEDALNEVLIVSTHSFLKEYCPTCDELRPSKELFQRCRASLCPHCKSRVNRKNICNNEGCVFHGKEVQSIVCGTDLPEASGSYDCPRCNEVTPKETRCKTCRNLIHSHYAMFPEELIEPLIKSAVPEQVCKKCGTPRFPIIEPSEEYKKHLGKGFHVHGDDQKAGMMQDKQVPAVNAEYRITGWTDCGCNAGWCTGLVADIFAGYNTVGKVATDNGRDFTGCDLDEMNVRAGMKRVEQNLKKGANLVEWQ